MTTKLKQLLQDVAARSGWGPEMLARIEAAHAELASFEPTPIQHSDCDIYLSVGPAKFKSHGGEWADGEAYVNQGGALFVRDSAGMAAAFKRLDVQISGKLGQGPVLAGWVNQSINGYIRNSDCVARYRDKTPGVGWEPVFFAGPGVGRPDTAPQQLPANVPQDDPNDSALPQALDDTAREIAELAMQQGRRGLLLEITDLKSESDHQRVRAVIAERRLQRLQTEFDEVRGAVLSRADGYGITHNAIPLGHVLERVLDAERQAGWAQDKEPSERQPLTDEQIADVWSQIKTLSMSYGRAIERACAEAWGVKLVTKPAQEGGAA